MAEKMGEKANKVDYEKENLIQCILNSIPKDYALILLKQYLQEEILEYCYYLLKLVRLIIEEKAKNAK